MPSVEVVRGVLDVEINVAEFLVGREGPPDSGIAGVVCRSVQPRFISCFAFTRDGVEDPQSFASANIEGRYVTLDVVIRGSVWRERRPHDDDIVGNHGRRAVTDASDDITFVIQIQLFKQIDGAVVAETGDGQTGLRV